MNLAGKGHVRARIQWQQSVALFGKDATFENCLPRSPAGSEQASFGGCPERLPKCDLCEACSIQGGSITCQFWPRSPAPHGCAWAVNLEHRLFPC